MWCSSCRADVAAELSTDNRRMLCARCQSELGIAAAALPRLANGPRSIETERDARELLARWSSQNLLDPAPSLSSGASLQEPGPNDAGLKRADIRFDQSHTPAPSSAFLSAAISKPQLPSAPQSPSAARPEPERSIESDSKRRERRKKARRLTEAAAPAVVASVPLQYRNVSPDRNQPLDHQHSSFEAPPNRVPGRAGWTAMAGNLCAYGGVGLLTCGTVMVMWSYFGGPANYMPTGCLAAAVGQMLLFLGVVTLISSGMEQTVAEVSWRIDHLAEEVHHMGLSLDELELTYRTGRRQNSTSRRDHIDNGSTRDAA